MIDARLIHRIIAGYELPLDGIHGLSHWARVLETGLRLAEQTGANRRVVSLFAVFHDARRRDEGRDDGHGARGARLARALRAEWLDLTDMEFALLEKACIHHTDGTVDGDITVQTCWDADRLDLWRVFIVPHNKYLCTSAARDEQIQEWARERSVKNYTPEYVTGVWMPSSR
jgi:uncharacterized protein